MPREKVYAQVTELCLLAKRPRADSIPPESSAKRPPSISALYSPGPSADLRRRPPLRVAQRVSDHGRCILDRVPSAVRSTFAGAARCFADLVGHIPATAWDGAGLGVWDLRSLVGHTGRAVSTVATYLQRPAAEERVPSAARYYALLQQQNGVDHSAVAERGRQAGSGLGPQPARTVHTLVEETLLALDAVTGDPLIDTFVANP